MSAVAIAAMAGPSEEDFILVVQKSSESATVRCAVIFRERHGRSKSKLVLSSGKQPLYVFSMLENNDARHQARKHVEIKCVPKNGYE